MRKIAAAIISISLVLALTSCSWQIPEKVSVKSNADYNFSLGTFEKELDSGMNLSSMMGDTGKDNSDIKTFDYWPGKKDSKTQHFLLQVKVYEIDLDSVIPNLSTTIAAIPVADDAEIDFSTNPLLSSIVNGFNVPVSTTGLEFNPSSMLSGMKEALGSDVAGLISFSDIPLYLYCETPGSIKTNATLKMFYGSSTDPIVERAGTSVNILTNSELTNVPLPTLETGSKTVKNEETGEETTSTWVTSDLSKIAFIGNTDSNNKTIPINIANLINDPSDLIQDGDQLCIQYSLSGLGGKITKAQAQEGLKIKLYAMIDLPLKFTVNDNVDIDLSSFMKQSESSSESENNASNTTQSNNNGSNSSESKEEDYTKYLKLVDSVSIKYIAYKLPIYPYSDNGLVLGIDFLGNGEFEYNAISVKEKSVSISESDKSVLTLKTQTIQKLKDFSSLKPNFKLQIKKDSTFSIPRDKAVEMYVEANLKTDGTVQIN